MATKRPAQGKNSTKKLVKVYAGGDNVSKGSAPAVNNNKKRGYAS